MHYRKDHILKNGWECLIRSAAYEDGPEVSKLFVQTHGESDFLLSYPEEYRMDDKEESEFLQGKADSEREVMLLAVLDGKIVGTADISAVGRALKIKHRAEFGIDVVKEYWGLGIGRALTNACMECAKEADYRQVELQVVAENERAINLYQSVGFVEFGRNPMGFVSKYSGIQELICMRLVL